MTINPELDAALTAICSHGVFTQSCDACCGALFEGNRCDRCGMVRWDCYCPAEPDIDSEAPPTAEQAAGNGGRHRAPPPPPHPEPDDIDEPPIVVEVDGSADFWQARPELAFVHAYAQARMAGPYGVLGCILAVIATRTPPWVQLPDSIGAPSLNHFYGLVGTPGGGKGTAMDVAICAVEAGDPIRIRRPGSGEGLTHLFVRMTKEGSEPILPASCLFRVNEISTQYALAGRRGSTLAADLRSAWSGEMLGGYAYVDEAKRAVVPAGSYRLVMVCGIQPARADVLLDDVDAGTPQRYLWFPVTDPKAPAPGIVVETPDSWHWRLPHPLAANHHDGSLRMDVAGGIVGELRAARHRALTQGVATDLGSRAGESRVKLAAHLALFAERVEVTEEDFELAGHLMKVSDMTRQLTIDGLAAARKAGNRRSGRAAAERDMARDDRIRRMQLDRTASTVRHLLDERTGWVPRREVSRRLSTASRPYLDETIGCLETAGDVEIRIVPGQGRKGTEYRWTGAH